jgi:hypothetical protein
MGGSQDLKDMWFVPVASPLWWWVLGFPVWFGVAPAFALAYPTIGVLVMYAVLLVGMTFVTRWLLGL